MKDGETVSNPIKRMYIFNEDDNSYDRRIDLLVTDDEGKEFKVCPIEFKKSNVSGFILKKQQSKSF